MASDSTWALVPELVTNIPLDVNLGLGVESSKGLLLSTSVGLVPSIYIDAINGVATDAGWYDESTAELIVAALEDALVWRTTVGYRPWLKRGVFFAMGYRLVTLGGGLSSAEVLSATTGRKLTSGITADRSFEITTVSHMLDAEAGWRWSLSDQLSLRVAVGAAFTIAASSEVKPNWMPTPRSQAAVAALADSTETFLNDTLNDYVHTATLSFGLGWRL